MEVLANNTENNQERQKRHNEQYSLLRGFNQLLSAYDFWVNVGPYPLHLIFDKEKNALLIQGDNTFSWIDIKTTNFVNAKKKLHALLEGIYGDSIIDGEMQLISLNERSKVQELTDKIFSHIKDLVKGEKATGTKAEKMTINHPNRTYRHILQKLHTDTYKHKDKLWDKNEANALTLNEEGKKYFSSILSDLYQYYEKTKFLGADREKRVFPNNTYIGIRTKLAENETLSTDELCRLINHLIISKDIEEDKDISDADKHHAKGLKKLMINQLWAMLYDEQSYSYREMQAICEDRSLGQPERDQQIAKDRNINDEYLHTETSFKGLSSIGSKELRREKITDMLRARTWVSDEELNIETVKEVFSVHIGKLKEYFSNQGYDLLIDSINLVNKFNEESGQIFISSDEEGSIQSSLKIYVSEESKHEESKPGGIKSFYTADLDSINYIDDRERSTIQNAFKKDSKKTGGNGNYADIKIRMSYRLRNKSTKKVIENTGGYEHMIVNMSSENECGLSDHNIILDPKKTIVNMIRTKSNIGIDEFFRLVSGGVDTLTLQLYTRKKRLDSPERNSKRPPKKYIETQYNLRNKVPQEFIDIANKSNSEQIPSEITYTDLDNNPSYKKRIEKAIAQYTLQDLFDKGLIQWYFYNNDNVSGLNETIQNALKNSTSYLEEESSKIIRQALNSKNQNEYRICGGGSNNLVSSLRNGTLSGKGVIGIPHNGSIMFFKVATLAGILADATHIQDLGSNNQAQTILTKIASQILGLMKEGKAISL